MSLESGSPENGINEKTLFLEPSLEVPIWSTFHSFGPNQCNMCLESSVSSFTPFTCIHTIWMILFQLLQMCYTVIGSFSGTSKVSNNLRMHNWAYRLGLDLLFKGKHQLQSIKFAIQTRLFSLERKKKSKYNTQRQQQRWVCKPGSSLAKQLIPSRRWGC